MNIERLAAIDIGSNAVRLLIANLYHTDEQTYIRKANLIRIPLRLGEEVFQDGEISSYRRNKLVQTMHTYQKLMEIYEVSDYRGCATSAMRESKNGKAIAKQIKNETGIEIEIISGKKEAEIIYSTQLLHMMEPGKTYLFVDVGGGSTELTFFTGSTSNFSKSFDIGTLRMRNDQVTEDKWNKLESWLKKMQLETPTDLIIGSGGNINKVFKLLNKIPGQTIHVSELNAMTSYLENQTVEQLIIDTKLRPDRADVIIPACHIFQFILKHSSCNEILVPKIGLADGIVSLLHQQRLKEKINM